MKNNERNYHENGWSLVKAASGALPAPAIALSITLSIALALASCALPESNGGQAGTQSAELLLRLPAQYNTPDAAELDAEGNVIISVPNFNSVLAADKISTEKAPAVMLALDKNNRLSTWYEFQARERHPDTGKVGPMSVVFGPDGNLYVADNQWFYDKNHQSRLIRINVENGKAVDGDVLVEGFVLANGVAWKGNTIYVADTILEPREEGKKLKSAVYAFTLDELNPDALKKEPVKLAKYDENNPDRHLVEIFHTDGDFGADGVTFDGQGNLYTSMVLDGEIYKTEFDAQGNKTKSTLFAQDENMVSADGIKWYAEDNKIYVADMVGNAIHAIDANGNVATLHKNGKSDGADGSLDEPSDIVRRGKELVIINMGLTFDDEAYALSRISLE